MPACRLRLFAALCAIILVPAATAAQRSPSQGTAAPAITTQTCLQCHGNRSLSVPDSTGQPRSLYVDETVFHESVHGIFDCQVCHQGITEIPHATQLPLVHCGNCHSDVAARLVGATRDCGSEAGRMSCVPWQSQQAGKR